MMNTAELHLLASIAEQMQLIKKFEKNMLEKFEEQRTLIKEYVIERSQLKKDLNSYKERVGELTESTKDEAEQGAWYTSCLQDKITEQNTIIRNLNEKLKLFETKGVEESDKQIKQLKTKLDCYREINAELLNDNVEQRTKLREAEMLKEKISPRETITTSDLSNELRSLKDSSKSEEKDNLKFDKLEILKELKEQRATLEKTVKSAETLKEKIPHKITISDLDDVISNEKDDVKFDKLELLKELKEQMAELEEAVEYAERLEEKISPRGTITTSDLGYGLIDEKDDLKFDKLEMLKELKEQMAELEEAMKYAEMLKEKISPRGTITTSDLGYGLSDEKDDLKFDELEMLKELKEQMAELVEAMKYAEMLKEKISPRGTITTSDLGYGLSDKKDDLKFDKLEMLKELKEQRATLEKTVKSAETLKEKISHQITTISDSDDGLSDEKDDLKFGKLEMLKELKGQMATLEKTVKSAETLKEKISYKITTISDSDD